MKHRNILTATIALLSGGLVIAGCSGWSSDPPMPGNAISERMNLASAQAAAPQSPANFAQALATEYSALATTLARTPTTSQSGDWVDSDYFSRKSMKAGDGATVLPENNATQLVPVDMQPYGFRANVNWLVPLEQPYGFRTQLADGRKRLVTALDNGGRDQKPALSAVAQSRYDCWVEQMERDWQKGASGTCRTEFLAALDELENPKVGTSVPPVTTQGYNVFFDFDKSSLSREGRQTIARAAKAVGGDSVVRIKLVGKADLAGTDPYNMALSHHRADAVRNALLADGVVSDRIDERWVGEREPPVPTAQGVREQRNRVVEVLVN
jgi:OmpA-OmpF porin, OOP family